MYHYDGFASYNALQTSLQRRFDNGFMFTVFYVWSKTLTTNTSDYTSDDDPNIVTAVTGDHAKIRQYDYSYSNWDRPHNFVINAVYQTPKVTDNVALGLLVNGWQLSGVFRLSSGQAYPIRYAIANASAANLSGTTSPSARIALTCDPGSGTSSDPYKQFDTSCFAPPQQGSNGLESARRFMHGPWSQNLDLSISKSFTFYKDIKFEIRLDAFNALNHANFTGVNNVANFNSTSDPTITNLPYNAAGELVNLGGFGSVNGVANPRTIQLVTRLTF